MIKMIVVDLDGTILNKDRKMSESTKKYLKKLKNNGYIITIATGRTLSSAIRITDGAEFADYIITDNGTCTYKASSQQLIFGNFIEKNVASLFFDYYNDDCRYIDFCDSDKIYKYSDEPCYDRNFIFTKDKKYIMNNCGDISRITMVMRSNDLVLKLYNNLINRFKQLEIVVMKDSLSDEKWIDVMPNNSSKYNMISKLTNYLGIKLDEVMAFGDGINDVELIKNCGYGVALLNALEEVKEVADDVTQLDHNNDGVINYLMEYLCNKEVQ